MRKNLIGELRVLKEFDIKPNFSALQRIYGIDRHTIKKYYEEGGIPITKSRQKSSKWDYYYEEIKTLIEKPLVSYKAAYMFLYNKYDGHLPGSYHSMRNYLYCKGHRAQKQNNIAHPLYEVDPGEQLQCDWKENLKITLKTGELIEFNVFSATLGYSRYHIFIYSPHKTTDDFLRCIIEVLRKLGGVTDNVLTDNMSAVVSVKDGKRVKQPKVIQFFKEISSKLILAKARVPQTKGKDENANKYMDWLYPYEGVLESEEELITLIEDTITKQCNVQVNTGTNMPPAALFKKEKEYLKPLPSNVLLETYLEEHYRKLVPSTLLVEYKGKKYSVPQEYINKYVDIYPVSNCLFIYHNKKLVAKHNITQVNINYQEKHYIDALKTKNMHKGIDEIEQMAQENLKKLERKYTSR